jgi:hypothetical protein
MQRKQFTCTSWALGIPRTMVSDLKAKHSTGLINRLGIPGCFPLQTMRLLCLNIPDLFLSLWRRTLKHSLKDYVRILDWAAVLAGNTWKACGTHTAIIRPFLPTIYEQPPRNPALHQHILFIQQLCHSLTLTPTVPPFIVSYQECNIGVSKIHSWGGWTVFAFKPTSPVSKRSRWWMAFPAEKSGLCAPKGRASLEAYSLLVTSTSCELRTTWILEQPSGPKRGASVC